MSSIKAFRSQLCLARAQQRELQRWAGGLRWVWNRALAEQRARRARVEPHAGHAQMCKWLTAWRRAPGTPRLASGPVRSQQQVLRRLDAPHKRFSDAVRKGDTRRVKPPRFRRRGEEPGMRFPDAKRLRLDRSNGQIFLPNLGWLRLRPSRPVAGGLRNAGLSRERAAQRMRETCGLALSQAAVIEAAVAASAKLTPVLGAIAGAIKPAPGVHANETGMRVNKALHGMHAAVASSRTLMARHTKRGQAAFEAIGSLPAHHGTLKRDSWMPHRALACLRGLCNAHHPQGLVCVHEKMHRAWAKDALDVLLQAHEQVQSTGKPLPPHPIDHQRFVLEQILQQGNLANPRQNATGKRARLQQSKARQGKAFNLIDRLRLHGDGVWCFATDMGVPFTNNLTELAVRKPQGEAKNPCCFRCEEGAGVYCTIRACLATLHKQGRNLFEALLKTFQTTPPMPALGWGASSDEFLTG